MAWTQTDLDNINTALAAGELTVKVGERLTTYRSVDELIKIRDMIRADLGTATANRRLSPRYRTARFDGE